MMLPTLAITMGDPAGTGPELITKVWQEEDVHRICHPLVVGDAATIERAQAFTGTQFKVESVKETVFRESSPRAIRVLDMANVVPGKLQLGAVSPEAGEAAYQYICKATELCLEDMAGAMVTNAINKESLNLAGHTFDGHTGLLSHLCQAPGATMMLAAGKLRVSHVSTHLPLREAIGRIRPERILKVISLTDEALRRMGIEKPSIAVAGLNPHAGERGLFGSEEAEFIEPAIQRANSEGFRVSGPYPGDTVFFRTLQGEFDAAVAMYHDQGHVAVKMLGIWLGVNITLGLPVIRTSVEHGTNFDLAGTGKSDPRSLLEAIRMAASMAAK